MIADYLQRFHQVSIASSSVHRLLGKHGMSRLPANQKHRPHRTRWTRYEKPQPGHRLQLDVKFLERIIDRGSTSSHPTSSLASTFRSKQR